MPGQGLAVWREPGHLRESTAAQYVFALALVAVAVVLRLPFEGYLNGVAPYSFFFLAILVVGWNCRVGPTLVAVALSFVLAEYIVVPPAWSFSVATEGYRNSLGLFLLTATVMVFLSRAASATPRRERDARLAAQLAQQGARAAIWQIDVGPRGPSGRERAPVAGVAGMLGLESPEFLAWAGGPGGRIHPQDAPRVAAELEEAMGTGRSLAVEFRFVDRDGGELWLGASGDLERDPDGGPRHVYGITQDITDRKRREQDQALLASIVASSDDAIISKSLDATILSWNAGAQRIFGYPADEVVGQSIEILIPPERRGEEAEILARLSRGERVDHFETVRVARDGRRVEVSLTISPLRDAAGRIVGASKISRDIGERKRAERELARQREWFRVTLTSIGDAVITSDREGRVTFLNPVAERLCGWPAAEAEGKPLRDVFRIVNEETRETVENPTEKVLRTGAIVGLANHTLLLSRGGPEYPIADSAAPILDDADQTLGVVLVFRDVSEERRVEETLAEQREWLETTLRSIGDAVIATDERGRVRFLNPVAERLTGWSAAKAEGRPCREVFRIVHEDSRAEVESPITRVLSEGRVVGLANHTVLLAADGTERPIDDSGAPILGLDGRVRGAVLVFRDVTDRRRVERERAAAAVEREHLLESERLARGEAERANRLKDEFIATLSHELRTPLNSILGWSQILRTAPPDAATLAHAVDVIERNTRAQTQLVSDLLDMSRIASGKLRLELQQVDLAQTVQSSMEALRTLAQSKNLRLKSEVPGPLDPVMGDPDRLQQILWNLLSNAIKFTPEGGDVRVSIRQLDTHAEIAVRDTGVGIKADFLEHLFDRFRQGDGSLSRRFGGLGLGLAIVKQLTELHGGQVWAESEGEGRGAAFFVRLPLARVSRESPLEVPAGQAETHAVPERDPELLRELRVLLVEDEPDTRDLLSRVLGDAGARVTTASDATEALEALERDTPDLLLSDIGLPGMDGYDLMRRIRASRDIGASRVPAIALTAFARPEDRARALAAGYQSYLTKPVESHELLATVASFGQLLRGGSD